jgi:hypothetical protein
VRHAATAQAAALRSAALVVLAILVPLGLSTKRYHGPGQAWVHANGGDALYAAFWFLFTRLVWPRLSLRRAAAGVLLFCWLIEFSQLLHPPWLDRLRRTLPGRLILGSDFEWVTTPTPKGAGFLGNP